ncbi:MAG: hypothetical protein Q8P20_05605 [bacterium]|nr:hypothetical protein [bacterium]
MKFIDKIKLVLSGHPIEKNYKISMSEESFKEKTKLKLITENDFNSFSRNKESFVGNFQGHYERELSIKPKSSFWRKDSLTNTIWIHGVIQPNNEKELTFKVTFYRTKFAKYGQWVILAVLALALVFFVSQTLMDFDLKNFGILLSTLAFFYLFSTLIKLSQTTGQIEYFEKNFFKDLK